MKQERIDELRRTIMKFEDLTNNQRGLLASYVNKAADGNLSRVCEDTNESDFEGFLDEEKESLCDAISKWNSDDPEQAYIDITCVGSWALVAFAAYLISPDAD